MAVDEAQEIVDILTNEWNSGNTDSITPTFLKIEEANRKIELSSGDYILVRRTPSTFKDNDLGLQSRNEAYKIESQLWVCGTDDDHFLNVRDEMVRIFYKRAKNLPNFDHLTLLGIPNYHNDRNRRIYRADFELMLDRTSVQVVT